MLLRLPAKAPRQPLLNRRDSPFASFPGYGLKHIAALERNAPLQNAGGLPYRCNIISRLPPPPYSWNRQNEDLLHSILSTRGHQHGRKTTRCPPCQSISGLGWVLPEWYPLLEGVPSRG